MSRLEEKFGSVGKKGNYGEIYLLKELKKMYTVSDYRNDMAMQRRGIDFGITKPGWRREYTLDSKTNLYLESDWYAFKIELESAGKPGWLYDSQADRIYHVNTYKGAYLYYNLPEMRSYITKRLSNGDMTNISYEYENGDTLLKIIVRKNQTHDLPISNLFRKKF